MEKVETTKLREQSPGAVMMAESIAGASQLGSISIGEEAFDALADFSSELELQCLDILAQISAAPKADEKNPFDPGNMVYTNNDRIGEDAKYIANRWIQLAAFNLQFLEITWNEQTAVPQPQHPHSSILAHIIGDSGPRELRKLAEQLRQLHTKAHTSREEATGGGIPAPKYNKFDSIMSSLVILHDKVDVIQDLLTPDTKPKMEEPTNGPDDTE